VLQRQRCPGSYRDIAVTRSGKSVTDVTVAWLYHRDELPQATTQATTPVAVVSGGNIDPGLLAATLAGN
jgi:hypothetical protein